MKIYFFILSFFLTNWASGQSVLKTINKKTNGKYNQEMILELKEVFKMMKETYQLDVDEIDTFYIIRGVDIQDRTGYGRIWNKRFIIHYTDKKEWQDKRIIGSHPVISTADKQNVTQNFKKLIPNIEKGDRDDVVAFANSHPVLSGVSWTIISYEKNNGGKAKTNIYSVPDFDFVE